ncbi:MAG: oxidoreductase, partial [Parapedobacter sp.]
YRSAVEYVGDRHLVATGTSGVDYSSDGGMTWKTISGDGYHVVRRAKKGRWILLAGAGGRIATLYRN